MKPVILFRDSSHAPGEMSVASKHCNVVPHRTQCSDRIVYGRYSCLPFYEELEEELLSLGSQLVNSYAQHQYIADFQYYHDVAKYTFPSWHNLADTTYGGPFVIKGRTNSRKHQWDTHMFAADRSRAMDVASELNNDGLIGFQNLIYRKYIPLKTFEVGLHDARFCNEWRIFYLGNKRLAHGFYWSQLDDLSQIYIQPEAFELADEVAKIVSESVNFFVLDVAEKEDGGWILVEVNDAQQSGLSMIDPEEFYGNLSKEMEHFSPI